MHTKQNRVSATDRIALSIIFAVVMIALIYCFSEGICGNDFWWHIKAGEWICEHGYIPKTDIFSWYGIQKGIPWTMHEWMAEVIFYQIYRCAGEAGIYMFSFAAAVIMLVLLWMQARERIMKNVLISGVFFGIASVILYAFFYGRPHIFSFFLLYFELKCLYGFWENQKSKWIYLIPVLACLWSNSAWRLFQSLLFFMYFDIDCECVSVENWLYPCQAVYSKEQIKASADNMSVGSGNTGKSSGSGDFVLSICKYGR